MVVCNDSEYELVVEGIGDSSIALHLGDPFLSSTSFSSLTTLRGQNLDLAHFDLFRMQPVSFSPSKEELIWNQCLE